MSTEMKYDAYAEAIQAVIKEAARKRNVPVAQIVAEAKEFVEMVQADEEERQRRLSEREMP